MKFAYADLNELMVGAAGEHIVCADLLARGYRALRADQSCPYDVAAEVVGRLIRIQVKTTEKARAYPQAGQRHVHGYIWNIRQGKGSNRAYQVGSIDMVALVALDVRRVAYIAFSKLRQTVQIPVSGALKSTRKFEDYSFERAVEHL